MKLLVYPRGMQADGAAGKTGGIGGEKNVNSRFEPNYMLKLSVKTKNFFFLQAKKDPGFHAKWNCWDQFWPGVVAPCECQLEKK